MAFSTFQRLNRLKERVNVRDLANFGTRFGSRYFDGQDDPQRAYLFEIKIQNPLDPFEELNLYARDVSIPEENSEPIEKHFMGKKFQYAGKEQSTKQVTINFWDDENLAVYQYFQLWMQLLHRRNGAQIYKEQYSHDFYIILKDTTDMFENAKFKLTNAFPTSIGEVSLSYENSEVMQFQVTLAFDDKIMGVGSIL